VIEAVTENPKVKEAVLADTESKVRDNTILASNTSTISITRLAKALKRLKILSVCTSLTLCT